ncbi:adenylate and guanylate cyclase catalytic domain-containing protein [Toxoplasma gondii]|uniref:Adenylate and guanylate cyclase catalytic domain-containing protein n=1 Tax=Toxoplasma gondii TaxID=5811 RepID=A0A7J6K5B9_TOXGO|nr:adenylate and guanylate cyclase catalytic domain-containing protein [Toxoplasma gondii]
MLPYQYGKYSVASRNPHNITLSIILVISTLNVFFALFGSDLQLAFFDKSADTAFQIGFIVSLVLFLTEMIVTILVDENYKWSFFFWLDVIATASLCLDVPWIIDPIYAFLFDAKTHRSPHAGTTAARAGRAGRIGARTGRVTRILRINRMIRVVKMSDVFAYFQKDKRNEDDDADSNMGAPPSQESSPQRRPSKSPKIEASRLSKTLSDSNTRKVVVSILLILTVQPLLMPDEEDNTAAAGLPMLFYFGSSHTKQSCDQQGWDFPCSKLNIAGNKPEKGWLTAEGWEKLLWVYKQSYKGTYLSGESFERQLLSLEVPDLEGGGRVQPLNKISSTDGGWVSHPECVSCSFTHTLVIEPIEKMVQIIKQLARDPLKRPQVTDSDEVATSKKNKNESKLGFGQAGAEIIAQNMSSEGGSLDLLIPGRKVYGVYGFADIVNFQDITECLSEEVMVFVNKIARIVHHCVNEWGGTTNKNIGDSFFVVWLVDDEEERDVADNKSLSRTSVLGIGKNAQTDTAVKKVKELCNRSLFSFLKILAEFGRASDLATYAKHPKIIPRFGAGYNVHINLGLHCGWAIQAFEGIQIVPPKLGKFHPPDDASETSENVDWMFMVDQDIAMMQRGITVEFQGMWRQALDNYLRGEWGKAEEFARKCLMVMPEDGPSLQLLNYLKSLDGVPPPDWQGYRNMQMK